MTERETHKGIGRHGKEMTLKQYKRHKLRVLKQLGFWTDASIFKEAQNEIQVDQIAHSIFMGKKKVSA